MFFASKHTTEAAVDSVEWLSGLFDSVAVFESTVKVKDIPWTVDRQSPESVT